MLASRPKQEIELILNSAEEAGIRIEFAGAVPLWEATPSARHQEACLSIVRTVRPDDAFSLLDVYVLFADGSLKRPDISLFCHRPAERDTAVTSVPKAVIEVLSPGFEAKDLQFGPAFYLSQGVLDVLVFDPLTNTAYHFTSGGVERLTSPTTVHFAMGCRVELPLMD